MILSLETLVASGFVYLRMISSFLRSFAYEQSALPKSPLVAKGTN
jgi:hypothetical protein